MSLVASPSDRAWTRGQATSSASCHREPNFCASTGSIAFELGAAIPVKLVTLMFFEPLHKRIVSTRSLQISQTCAPAGSFRGWTQCACYAIQMAKTSRYLYAQEAHYFSAQCLIGLCLRCFWGIQAVGQEGIYKLTAALLIVSMERTDMDLMCPCPRVKPMSCPELALGDRTTITS